MWHRDGKALLDWLKKLTISHQTEKPHVILWACRQSSDWDKRMDIS
jgi:hypothetical protein